MSEPTPTLRATARTLWRLGWPLAIMLQLASLSEMIVMFWLGRIVGPSGLATEATMRFLFLCAGWIMVGVGIGVSVLVSHSVGAKDGRGLAIVVNGLALCAVLWAIALASVLPLSGVLGDALASSGVPASQLERYFIPWVALALPGIGIVQVLLQTASGAGWTRLSLTRSVIDLALMAITIPIFVGAIGLGVTGAPVAMGLAQLVVAVVLWRTLRAHAERLRLGTLPRGPLARHVCWQILDVGMPPQLARIAMLGSYAYLVQRVASVGGTAVASFGIALAVFFLCAGITSALGRATGILVGQSVGARAKDRLLVGIRAGSRLAIVVGVGLAGVLALVAAPVASLFTSRTEIVDGAAASLRILAFAVPFTAISQQFLFVLTAMKASKLAGILGAAADAIGIAVAISWPGSALAAVAWSIVISNAVRAAFFAGLWWLRGDAVVSRALGQSR